MCDALLVLAVSLAAVGGQPLCVCPDIGVAAVGTTPSLVVPGKDGSPGLMACGYRDPHDPRKELVVSGLAVYSCGSREPVLSFGDAQYTSVRALEGNLLVTELTRWPFGRDWEWVDLPMWEHRVTNTAPPRVFKSFVLVPPKLKAAQIRQALDLFEKAKTSRKLDNYEEVIGRILVAALAGSAEARSALSHMWDYFDLDAASAELCGDAIELFQVYAEATGKVQRLPGV